MPGGGVAFLRCIPALENIKGLEDDEKVGVNIIRRALEEPIRQLTANAAVDGSVIVQRVKLEKKNVGYDVTTGTFIDMLEAGIIDPTKVTRSALQNASSIAALLLTTEALVTDLPEKDKPGMSQMPQGGMGMGGY